MFFLLGKPVCLLHRSGEHPGKTFHIPKTVSLSATRVHLFLSSAGLFVFMFFKCINPPSILVYKDLLYLIIVSIIIYRKGLALSPGL